MKISDLKPSPNNPRIIGKIALTGLGFSLEEFGGLSGIVFNTKTGHLVCGHQRIKVIKQVYDDDVEIKNNVIMASDGHSFPIGLVQ